VLLVYIVVGGFQALIPFTIILLEAGGVDEVDLLSTLDRTPPEVLGWAAGTSCLVLLLFLAIGVRMFHRRTFRSVWAGAQVRWGRWARSMAGAAGGLAVAAALGWTLGSRSVGSTLFLTFGLVGVVAQALNVESFRGYMTQSLVARGGHWRIRGVPVTPFLLAGAFLLPGLALLVLLIESDIANLPAAYVSLYLTGCVIVPGLLILLDDGLERAVGVQVAVRGGALLFVTLGVPGLPVWAWGTSAAFVGVGGMVLWRKRIRTPVRLWAALRHVLVRDTRVALTDEVESEGECRNCGTPLVGRYCHRCGQRHRTAKPSITMVVERIVDSVFEVDSRILRTLRLLFLRPGALSAHYFAGRRADFIPPIRLYLVASVVFFLPFAALVPSLTEDEDEVEVQVSEATVNRLADGTLTVEDMVRQARFTGSAALDSLPRDTTGTRGEEAEDELEDRFPDSVDERVDVVRLGADSLVVLAVSGLPDALYNAVADAETFDVSVQVRRSTLDSLSADLLTPEEVVQRGLFFGEAATDSLPPTSSGVSAFSDGMSMEEVDGSIPSVVKRRVEVGDVSGDSLVVLEVSDISAATYRAYVPPEVQEAQSEETEEENTAFKTVLQNLGQVMFLLMPLFALILSMVYLREPYAHHIIFSLHVHSFAFFVVGAQLIMEVIGLPTDVLLVGRFVVGTVAFVYLIGAMRRAYGSTLLRTIGIVILTLFIYMMIAAIVFGSTVGILQQAGDQLPQGFL
jgi:hypothetical protein